MGIYSRFLYGDEVYGPTVVGASRADIIGDNLIALYFDTELAVNSDFLDPDNYVIAIAYGDGNPIQVLEVLPPQAVATDKVYLRTDYHTNGTVYTVAVSNVVSRDGSVAAVTFDVLSRATKLDAMYANIPAHYSKEASSVLKNILVAISQSDDRIGGSRDDELP